MLFFSEFSSAGRVWMEFGTKVFSCLFLCLSHPVFPKNNTGKRFFSFLNSFATFYGIFFLGSVMKEIRDENFFVSFSAYLIPFGLKIMPERGFLIFWIFLLFFSEFSSADQVWTEFGTKVFLSLSRPILSRLGKK